ncbi:MAG: hypothetical protein HY268_31560 [Deltaproteobacteria bacterium]|nr:hypothetical protein [Deltaproteobacteria bacterium]
MAQGKEIGAFTLKGDAFIYTPGPGQSVTVQVCYSGPVTGEVAGTHRGTMTVVIVPGAKVVTYTYCGVTYLPTGDAVGVTSQGTGENIGNNKRQLRGVNYFSDGRIAAVEAEGDLVEGTLTGKLFEWS